MGSGAVRVVGVLLLREVGFPHRLWGFPVGLRGCPMWVGPRPGLVSLAPALSGSPVPTPFPNSMPDFPQLPPLLPAVAPPSHPGSQQTATRCPHPIPPATLTQDPHVPPQWPQLTTALSRISPGPQMTKLSLTSGPLHLLFLTRMRLVQMSTWLLPHGLGVCFCASFPTSLHKSASLPLSHEPLLAFLLSTRRAVWE